MTGQSSFFLPLPFLSTLLGIAVAILLWRMDLGRTKARFFFVALFVVLAFEAFLVGLRFGYGNESFVILQRILPFLVGPLLYLGFASFAMPNSRIIKISFAHIGFILGISVAFVLFHKHLGNMDWAIGVSYLYYITALVLLWHKGPDHLRHARLDLVANLSKWILGAAGFLSFILIVDTGIALDFAWQGGAHVSDLLTYATIPIVLVLLGIIVALASFTPQGPKPMTIVQLSTPDGIDLEQAAQKLLADSELYLDPDLSVHRLAKRLHVPARNLSAAINQTQGMNVSQYVNGFRLRHAAELLRTTDNSVADVMTQSGFVTRSNFYREFNRVYGKSPALYRQENS